MAFKLRSDLLDCAFSGLFVGEVLKMGNNRVRVTLDMLGANQPGFSHMAHRKDAGLNARQSPRRKFIAISFVHPESPFSKAQTLAGRDTGGKSA